MAGLKVSILGPEIGEKWGFRPQMFRWHLWTPISEHISLCDKVSQKSAQGRRKICGGKTTKINTAKI